MQDKTVVLMFPSEYQKHSVHSLLSLRPILFLWRGLLVSLVVCFACRIEFIPCAPT